MPMFRQPEGSTPIDDVSGLKIQSIYSIQQLNQVEMANILKATRKRLFERVPNPYTWFYDYELIAIHNEMFCEVWEWAGKFRTSTTNIGVDPSQIGTMLRNLCDDVQFWRNTSASTFPILERAARIHYRLVSIHPFPNGNGRFSRLIADMYLKGLGEKYPVWPTDLSNDGPKRQEYLDAIRKADAGDIQALINFMEPLLI